LNSGILPERVSADVSRFAALFHNANGMTTTPSWIVRPSSRAELDRRVES